MRQKKSLHRNLWIGFAYTISYIGVLPAVAFCQNIMETESTIEEIWQTCLEEHKAIEKNITKGDNNINEEDLLKYNKLLPNKGGLRTQGVKGLGWIGEIRICTIPKNIQRGEKPYTKIGLIVQSNGTTRIFCYPETKKTLEYLNLGGDWLGYNLKDTKDAPRIVEK